MPHDAAVGQTTTQATTATIVVLYQICTIAIRRRSQDAFRKVM